MKKFIIQKNTLPYVRQWAVISLKTKKKISEHKTLILAEEARTSYELYGLPDPMDDIASSSKNALKAASERMKRPDGDPLPKQRHSNTRKIRLD